MYKLNKAKRIPKLINKTKSNITNLSETKQNTFFNSARLVSDVSILLDCRTLQYSKEMGSGGPAIIFNNFVGFFFLYFFCDRTIVKASYELYS